MPTRPKGSKRPAYVYRQCMSLSCGLLLVRLKEAFLTMAKPPAAKALEGSGHFLRFASLWSLLIQGRLAHFR